MLVKLKLDFLKKVFIISLLISSIPILSAVTAPVNGIKEWSVDTVATSPYEIKPSIVVDASGSPHIAYISRDGLMYTFKSGETWSKEVVNSVEDYAEYELPIENFPGVEVSFDSPEIALDSLGRPHIAHFTKIIQCTDRFCTFWLVNHAAKSGGNWTDEILLQDSLAGGFSNLRFAIDPIDNLHVTALSYDGVGVVYSPYNATTALHWNFTSVPFIDAPGSIAADASGTPHICGQPSDSGDLAYIYRSGANWTYESTELTVSLNGCSIDLDSFGNLHISFTDQLNKTLWYAIRSNSSWEVEPVATNTAADPQLILDASGNPHILYTDASSGHLKYAVKSGENWIIETIDTGEDWVRSPSFALDDNGYPHIVYLDTKDRTLKYVTTKADPT